MNINSNDREKKIQKYIELKRKCVQARDIIGHGRMVISHARANFDGSDQMLQEKRTWDMNKTKAQEFIRRNGKKLISLREELEIMGVDIDSLKI